MVCAKIAFGADGALFVHVRGAGTTLVCIKRLSPEFLMFFNDRRPPALPAIYSQRGRSPRAWQEFFLFGREDQTTRRGRPLL